MASRVGNFAPVGSLLAKQPRAHDPKHLAAVRQLPCIACLTPGPNEAAHIRMGSKVHGKPITGIGQKPSDCWVLPMCHVHHVSGQSALHRSGERKWFDAKGIDPLSIARALYEVSGNIEEMTKIVIKSGCRL